MAAITPTFSRESDGRTPQHMPEYRRKMDMLAKQVSVSLHLGRYMDAQVNDAEIEAVLQQEQEFRKAREQTRQLGERALLDQAFKIENKCFEAEWAAKIQAVQDACEQKQKIMEEVHEVRRADFERELGARIAGMRFRASPKLLELEDQEKRLARGKEYKGAAEIGMRAARLRAKEMMMFGIKRNQVASKPRAEFDVAIQVEMRNLKQKCHALRLNIKREKAQAFAVFEQRYRNLDTDLSHAHAIEYTLPAEVGPVLAYPSRSTHSATFLGSLKLESVAGTKFDVKVV